MSQPSPVLDAPLPVDIAPQLDPRLKQVFRQSVLTGTPAPPEVVAQLKQFVQRTASRTTAPDRGEVISFLFLDDDPETGFIVFVQLLAPGGGFLNEHFHLGQREIFVILEGTASYRLDGEDRTAGPYETVIIEGDAEHINPWNDAEEGQVVLLRIVTPSQDTETFYDNWYGLVRDGRHLNKKSLEPNLIQSGMMNHAYESKTYFTFMPAWLQRIGAFFSYYLGKLIGYKAEYPEYASLIRGQGVVVGDA